MLKFIKNTINKIMKCCDKFENFALNFITNHMIITFAIPVLLIIIGTFVLCVIELTS